MNYMPIRQRPLLRVDTGELLPLSMQFSLDKMGNGVYWSLFDHFLAQGRLGDFTDRIGKPFEAYICELLESAHSTRSTTAFQRFTEDEIQPVAGAVNAPTRRADCLLRIDDSLFVMEISTLSLKVATIDHADTAAFEEEVRERFSHEFAQVFDVIEGLRLGTLEVPGLDARGIRHVFPVLVLLRPFPQLPSVWNKLREMMLTEWPIWPDSPHTPIWDEFGGVLAATQIHYPQILSAEELEMLEPLIHAGRTTLADILLRKLAHPLGALTDMKRYLLAYSGLPELPNQRLLEKFEAVVEEARAAAHYHAGP